jgi:Ca2+/Na+ antiporter
VQVELPSIFGYLFIFLFLSIEGNVAFIHEGKVVFYLLLCCVVSLPNSSEQERCMGLTVVFHAELKAGTCFDSC